MYLFLRYFVVHVSYMVESTLLSQKQSSAAKLCDNFLQRLSVGPSVRRKGGDEERSGGAPEGLFLREGQR